METGTFQIHGVLGEGPIKLYTVDELSNQGRFPQFTLRSIAKALRCLNKTSFPSAYRRNPAQMSAVNSTTNYEGWSSDQLINRIKDLETQLSKPPSTLSRPNKYLSIRSDLILQSP